MLKKARVLILAVMTATVMLLGSTAAFAAVDNSGDEPKITKNVTIADGVTLADTTVTFNVQQVANPDGLDAPDSIADYPVTGTVSSSKTTVNDVALGIAGKIDKTKPGEYTFEVSEEALTPVTNWTSDDTVYLLQVLVKNDQTVTYSVTEKNATEAAKTDLIFTNVYKATANLSVSKAVTGDAYVAADTEYTFKATFAANGSTAQVPAKVMGKIGETSTEYTVSNNEVEFTLKKGETITFEGLPAGIKYTVTEEKPSPTTVTYTNTTVDQKIDGEAQTQTTGLASASNAVLGNAGENSVAFTNNYQQITPTGLIISYLPYIAMILLAMAALALYVVSKRRRAARY